jgi:hypothetical protein
LIAPDPRMAAEAMAPVDFLINSFLFIFFGSVGVAEKRNLRGLPCLKQATD